MKKLYAKRRKRRTGYSHNVFAAFLILLNLASSRAFVAPRQTEQQHQQHHRGGSQVAPTSALQAFPLLNDIHVLLSKEIAETSTNVLASYSSLLQTHPLETKSVTAAILACIGDAIAQIRSKEAYDTKRGLAFLVFGAAYTGAFQHFWFGLLNNHVVDWGMAAGLWSEQPMSLPIDAMLKSDDWWRYFDLVSQLEQAPSDTMLASAKLAVNQFGMVPLVYMPLFFVLTGAVSGLDWSESKARARSLFLPLLMRNYFFWLPVQFVQFLVLPLQWQIPFLSAASLVWTVILSSIGGSTESTKSPATIVSYQDETDAETGQQQVVVKVVQPGPANQITDNVRLEDVQTALVPEPLSTTVKQLLQNKETMGATSGLAAGLIASAADDGFVGNQIGELLGLPEVGSGVAATAAMGAAAGLFFAKQAQERREEQADISAEEVFLEEVETTMAETAVVQEDDARLQDVPLGVNSTFGSNSTELETSEAVTRETVAI